MDKLLVEIDFEHSQTDVILRLFQCVGDQRIILGIQEIYNICHQIRRDADCDWIDDDRSFFLEVWPFVNKPGLLKSNAQVIKISRTKFDRVLKKWASVPTRFYDKSTGLAYSQNIPRADIRIDLEVKGDTTQLCAMIVVPDGNETPYFRARRHPGNSREPRVIIDNVVHNLSCPVDSRLMSQVFGETNPIVATDRVIEHLPVILQNRLELLSGPAIVRKTIKSKARVVLKADGADILMTIFLGPAVAQFMPGEALTAAQLRREGRKFVISDFLCDDGDSISKSLHSISLTAAHGAAWKIRGVPDEINTLYNAVRELEGIAEFDIDKELLTLFGDNRIEVSFSACRVKGWLEVTIDYRLDNDRLTPDDINFVTTNECGIIRTQGGKWLRLDQEQVDDLREKMSDLQLTAGTQRVPVPSAENLVRGLAKYPDLRVPKSTGQVLSELRTQLSTKPPSLSKFLIGYLREYQITGVEFLCNRTKFGLGCLLADDMGLGKTAQVLAYLSTAMRGRPRGNPALIVCPASVVSVWLKEAETLCPDLNVTSLQGPPEKRRELLASLDRWDVLIATYAVIRNDLYFLKKINFFGVILDEAQQIKNPDAEVTCAAKSLVSENHIAVTGTPLENRLTELWSIVDFLNPGYLGDVTEFTQRFGKSRRGTRELAETIKPLILRRSKREVAPELPLRTIETLYLPLSDIQRELYTTELAISKNKIQRAGAVDVLAVLTRLRQICCHPSLVLNKDVPHPECSLETGTAESDVGSAKLDCLIDKLTELRAEGHSALIFSQFTRMLEIIEERLALLNIKTHKITGATPGGKRAEYVRKFQESADPEIFLLSLKAAGTGLTLTKADYVFIYDPWWNPAVELQAIDRTHRIGQDKPVIAYRLVTAGTVEENVMRMQEVKQQLFADVIDGAENLPSELSVDDLVALIG